VRVIFLGAPGAGKGTQAERLSAHLRVPKISTGDMLREAIAAGTPAGRVARPLIDKGDFAPDELLLELVRERTARRDCERGFILDGFPRTVVQAEGLERLPDGAPEAFVVIDLDVPREVIPQRLTGRRWCPSCQATYNVFGRPPRRDGICDVDGAALVLREDDAADVIPRRLEVYEQRTLPVVDHYRRRGRLVRVDGNRPMDAVFDGLLDAVEVSA
jgi:adenylate kinase